VPDLSGLGASARGATARLWPAALVGLGLIGLLGVYVGLDPARGVTFSGSPFSDEGWNALNSRNLVLLGKWATDAWQLQWVHLPYSVLVAGAFSVLGVGIIQLRLVSIVLVGVTAATLAGSLARPLGRGPAVVAGLAFGANALILYYGRLGYLEDLVVAALVAGSVLVLLDGRAPLRSGVAGGLLLAIAIGTKPNAAFSVVGFLLGALLAGAGRDCNARRRFAAAAATIIVAGAAWLVTIAIPNRDAIAVDVNGIWPTVVLPHDLRSLRAALTAFIHGDDQLGALIGPLAIAAIGAVAVIATRWQAMTAERRRLAGAAAGWIVLGLGIIVVARYHPNRYAVPVVPGFAILTAVGLAELLDWLGERAGRTGRRAPGRIASGTIALALVAPGLLAMAGWVAGGASTLPDLQRAYAAEVPAGAAVAGADAPVFLMAARVATIVTGAGPHPPNAGDLYAQAGVRWYLDTEAATPEVATSHPSAWAARERIRCDPWAGVTFCLYRVP